MMTNKTNEDCELLHDLDLNEDDLSNEAKPTKPLQTKEKISDVPMIVICGLPRTGTTLLHNLMACDPSC
ncbi:unnamed protein product [Rotaria sordida]|uniref:Uncharacterized protein n=1 Tax=Rotaria sordida TaxID=392033 RepID=A0A819SU45_9BILA|nr:unnamed protein product [Rotaria sordida]